MPLARWITRSRRGKASRFSVAASKAGKKDVAKKHLEDLVAQAKEADDTRTAELKEANKLLAEK